MLNQVHVATDSVRYAPCVMYDIIFNGTGFARNFKPTGRAYTAQWYEISFYGRGGKKIESNII